MGLLDTLANILTREPKARPEYGPMSDALAEQAKGYGVTGGLLNAIDPYILDPMNAPERKWVRQNLAAKSAKDMVAPSAEAMERVGMAGIFAGPGAKTADLVALKKAEELAAKGVDNEAVRQATGWFKGMDGKWRFEIDDSKAFVKGDPVQRVQNVRDSGGLWYPTINDVLYHKNFYEAYPDAKKIPVDFRDGGGGAYGSGHIQFGKNSLRDKSTPLHELEHYVQDVEDFARGGNPNIFVGMQSPRDIASDATSAWAKKNGINSESHPLYPELVERVKKDQEILGGEDWLLEQYQNLAGEIEARDVSARMNLTPEQRLATPPDLRSDAIVRYGNGPQMSVPGYVEDAAERQKNFERWFGDSKVVDAEGKPLTVYHGTASDFDSFSIPKKNRGNAYDRDSNSGVFLTGQPEQADYFAFAKASGKKKAAFSDPEGQRTVASNLSMKNPMVVDYTGAQRFKNPDEVSRLSKEAKKNGHDGLILKGIYDAPIGRPGDVYVAFKPTQIKSIFNRGTYDPTDPNILKSLIPAAATAYGIEEVLPYD